jgi:hypothetical protein
MRKYTLDRWNFSEKAGKWVYVTKKKSGKRKYYYQIEPPEEFIELTMQIKDLNEKMQSVEDLDENEKLFRKLMDISKKMQNMRR